MLYGVERTPIQHLVLFLLIKHIKRKQLKKCFYGHRKEEFSCSVSVFFLSLCLMHCIKMYSKMTTRHWVQDKSYRKRNVVKTTYHHVVRHKEKQKGGERERERETGWQATSEHSAHLWRYWILYRNIVMRSSELGLFHALVAYVFLRISNQHTYVYQTY